MQKEIFVENRRKKPTTYCLSYVQRSKLSRLYQQEKNKLQREIAELVQLAETENNQKELVLKSYFQMLPLFEKLKEVEVVLLSVGRTSYMGDSVLDQVAITIPSENYIRNIIDQLILYQVNNLDDAVRSLQFQIDQQSDAASRRILVNPFTYQETNFSSQFAQYLKQKLELNLTNSVPKKIDFEAQLASVTRDLVTSSGADYLMSRT